MAGKAKKGGREGTRGAYSTPPPKTSAGRAGRGTKQPPAMRATWSRAGPTPAEEVKEVGGELLLAVSQPDVVLEPLPVKIAAMIGEGPSNDDVFPLAVVEPELYKSAAAGLKIATLQDQDAPLSADVPQEACQGAALKKAPKAPKEIQPTKQGLKRATPLKIDAPLLADVPQEPCQGLKIAMLEGQDAPLSADVSQEQGQDATLKKVPKAPKVPKEAKQGLKMATPALQDAPLSLDVPQEPCQDASSKKGPTPKAPMEAQPTKQGLNLVKGSGMLKAQTVSQPKEVSGTVDMIVLEGSSPLKVQKSGQAKKLSGTAGSKPPKTQVNKRKAKADVEEKEGTAVPKQQNVKRLKRMKEVEVREAIERKLSVDEVKVKGHTGKGQLEKMSEVKIALKRDGVKNMAKKHVEKGQENEAPANKALALVNSSKRPKLQVKRAKQSGASCTTSTTMHRIKVGTLIVFSDDDKSSEGSSGGSDDDGDEDDESNQDGSRDVDPNYGSDGDADDDDGGSDKSGGGDDDISGGSDISGGGG
ncbi:hypothetical protein L7F22_012900 [Adiantum nelumboides]|nr:hypothetical protein [Adiantum nelumboides]